MEKNKTKTKKPRFTPPGLPRGEKDTSPFLRRTKLTRSGDRDCKEQRRRSDSAAQALTHCYRLFRHENPICWRATLCRALLRSLSKGRPRKEIGGGRKAREARAWLPARDPAGSSSGKRSGADAGPSRSLGPSRAHTPPSLPCYSSLLHFLNGGGPEALRPLWIGSRYATLFKVLLSLIPSPRTPSPPDTMALTCSQAITPQPALVSFCSSHSL